jgi:hypothetical protein
MAMAATARKSIAAIGTCWRRNQIWTTGRVPNQITIEPLFFTLIYSDAITVCVTKSVAVVVKVFI